MSPRQRRLALLDSLLRLRRLYAMRGPRDGRHGLTPSGQIALAGTIPVDAAVADAEEALASTTTPTDLARWRAAMGLDQPTEPAPAAPTVRSSWTDQCPSRGAGLTHAHWRDCKPGAWHPGTQTRHLANQCCHCEQTI